MSKNKPEKIKTDNTKSMHDEFVDFKTEVINQIGLLGDLVGKIQTAHNDMVKLTADKFKSLETIIPPSNASSPTEQTIRPYVPTEVEQAKIDSTKPEDPRSQGLIEKKLSEASLGECAELLRAYGDYKLKTEIPQMSPFEKTMIQTGVEGYRSYIEDRMHLKAKKSEGGIG